MVDSWPRQFQERMRVYESGRPAGPGEVAISIKIRVTSGCFHREHSPRAYEMIDRHISVVNRRERDWSFQEHESGPEVLAYVAFAVAGLSMAKSVIDLVVAVLNARSAGIRKGDGPSEPLEVVVRRSVGPNEVREEIAFRIGHSDAARRAEVERQLMRALEKLVEKGSAQPSAAKEHSQPRARSKRKIGN